MEKTTAAPLVFDNDPVAPRAANRAGSVLCNATQLPKKCPQPRAEKTIAEGCHPADSSQQSSMSSPINQSNLRDRSSFHPLPLRTRGDSHFLAESSSARCYKFFASFSP